MQIVNEFFTTLANYRFEYLPKQKGYSINTITSYRKGLTLFVNYLTEVRKIPIKDIDFPIMNSDIIFGFLEWLETERGCSVATRNQRLMVLRAFFSYAGRVDCSLISTSLMVSNIPAKKASREPVEYLSEKALEVLLQQPDINTPRGVRNLFFMVLMYDTAARCGELQVLRIKDIRLDDPDPIVYLHGKGNKVRRLPLFKRTISHYENYKKLYHPNVNKDSDDLVFYTVSHGVRHPMSPDAIALFFNKYSRMAHAICPEVPEKINPHMLRHTRAMHLYQSGLPLNLISEMLGHSQVDTTRIYAYADSEMKRDAIEKADPLCTSSSAPSIPIWENDEEMIKKLCGLI